MAQSLNKFIIVKKEVKEEVRSKGGIIITPSSAFDFGEEFSKKNTCYAQVLYDNPAIPFLKSGDRIMMNPNKGTTASIEYEDFTVITDEQFLAKIDGDGKFIVPPNCVMVKIRKTDTENLYSKWIVKHDGSRVQLFIQSPPESHADNRSQIFVSRGDVIQVGSNIKNVYEGDIAILDYTVDNFTDNVLYYDDDGNKYIVIEAITTYHEQDLIIYADRTSPKDTLVYQKGDMNIVSPLLGVIRDEQLIARKPYVFLEHRNAVVEKTTKAGIVFSEKEEISERKILSIDEESERKYQFKKEQVIVVKEYDIFDVNADDYKIQCVLDQDILMSKIGV